MPVTTTHALGVQKTLSICFCRFLVEKFILVILGDILSIMILKKAKGLHQCWDEEISTIKFLSFNVDNRECYQTISISCSAPSKLVAETRIKVLTINIFLNVHQFESHVKSTYAPNLKLLT